MAKVIGTPSRNEIGIAICNTLKLDPFKVRSIDIHLQANNIAEITIKRFMESDELGPIIEILEKYNLTPVRSE